MAKVVNQDIPASEVLYDPDPARPLTLGDVYIQALTEGHNSPVPPGTLIVQRSPRQGRPSQRGPGTPAQAAQRACFQCCAQMWRDSTQYYKNCVKDVYNNRPPPAKDRQVPPKWFSTPYSTFLNRCLKECREVGSCSFDPYDIFPCPDPDCVASSIGYTTTQMSVNESQQLTIINQNQVAVYGWVLSGGAGTLSENGGYVAPATNPNCDANATIDLYCNGNKIDTLEISINGWMNACDMAYREFATQDHTYNPPDGLCCFTDYNCLGERIIVANCPGKGSSVYCTGSYPTYANYAGWPQGGGCAGTSFYPIYDFRSNDMKNGGCCPEGLL